MTTEDLIRESLAKQADRAPAPGPVLAALHRQPGRRRLVVAAVVGVLVIAAGVVALRRSALIEPLPPAAPPVPLRYSPTWLPEGFTEQARGYTPDGSTSRAWLSAPMSADQDVLTTTGPSVGLLCGPYGTGVDRADVVGGIIGDYTVNLERNTFAFSWTPEPDGPVVTVVVDDLHDGRAVLEQVVQSVRPDSTTRMPIPLLVDSGPHTVRGTPGDWWAEAFHSFWQGSGYTARLESRQPSLTGEPAVVRGVRGIVGEQGLAVRLAPDRWLTVRPRSASEPIPEDQLVAIANAARIDLYADVSWLGTR